MCAPVAKRFPVDAHGGGQRVSGPEISQAGVVSGGFCFVDKKDLDTASLRQVIEDALR
jgi:hypothetical protein